MSKEKNITSSASSFKETLPVWDLKDLYSDIDDPAMLDDLRAVEVAASKFARLYEGKIDLLDCDELAAAIGNYEQIHENLSRAMSYAQLVFSEHTENINISVFYQHVSERVNLISTLTIFFELEINNIQDPMFSQFAESVALKKYKSWILGIRQLNPFQLSTDLEKLLQEKAVSGKDMWSRLFDQTLTKLRFVVGKEHLDLNNILSRMSEYKAGTRREAALSLGRGLKENIQLFSIITNTLAKDKEVEDRWRGFKHPASARNLENRLEDPVVDALVNSVRKAYPRLSHRYYAMKSRWMGKKYLDHWDRNAPLSESSCNSMSWDTSKKIILDSYDAFDPRLRRIAEQFFDNDWIHANPSTGKCAGAFSHPTVPSVHPYILLNFNGKYRDVMTLAHELGHGIHQVLAAQNGYLLSNTPVTFAETASAFGEMLTFQTLLKTEKDLLSKRALLAAKVEDMLNTVIRQISFYEFEEQIHVERRKGELESDKIGEIWMSTQRESLGPSFKYSPDYSYHWAYIHHFIHSPFYVYSYAFGICLVNSLYDLYITGHPNFREKFIIMLEAGGSLDYKKLLEPFELDLSNHQFWEFGLNTISNMLDELEEIR